MSKYRIRFLGVALVLLSAFGLASSSRADTGTVRVVFTKGGFIVGVGGGHGVLNFHGHNYRFGDERGLHDWRLDHPTGWAGPEPAKSSRYPGNLQRDRRRRRLGRWGWRSAASESERRGPAAGRRQSWRRTVGGGGWSYARAGMRGAIRGASTFNIVPPRMISRAARPGRYSGPCRIVSATAPGRPKPS